LNDRGKKDAPAMAERLYERGIKIDAFVTSPRDAQEKLLNNFRNNTKKTKTIWC
jgi:phosphohistidine phosphatase